MYFKTSLSNTFLSDKFQGGSTIASILTLLAATVGTGIIYMIKQFLVLTMISRYSNDSKFNGSIWHYLGSNANDNLRFLELFLSCNCGNNDF